MFGKIVGFILIVSLVTFVGGVGLPVWADSSEPAATGQVAVAKININTASREELMRLKGVGPVYADRIMAHRKERGPFQKPEDRSKGSGKGPGRPTRMSSRSNKAGKLGR